MEQRQDCLDAYRWVLSPHGLNQALSSAGKVEPERTFIFGGSAGGIATFFMVRV